MATKENDQWTNNNTQDTTSNSHDRKRTQHVKLQSIRLFLDTKLKNGKTCRY